MQLLFYKAAMFTYMTPIQQVVFFMQFIFYKDALFNYKTSIPQVLFLAHVVSIL